MRSTKKSRRAAALKGWRTRRLSAIRNRLKRISPRKLQESKKALRRVRRRAIRQDVEEAKLARIKQVFTAVSRRRASRLLRRTTLSKLGTIQGDRFMERTYIRTKKGYRTQRRKGERVRRISRRQYAAERNKRRRAARLEAYQEVYGVDEEEARKMERDRARIQRMIDKARGKNPYMDPARFRASLTPDEQGLFDDLFHELEFGSDPYAGTA